MIPRDWTQHVPAQRGNRFLSDYGSVILPETSPLSIHQWQDVGIDHWQDDGCSWPLMEAGWEFSSGSEQRAWDWNPGTEESYTIWTDCPMPEDPACWMNDSHITEHVPVLKQLQTLRFRSTCLPSSDFHKESWQSLDGRHV